MKKITPPFKKQDTGLNNKSGNYPPENILSHPVIIRSTVSAALLVGIMAAVVAWLLSAGMPGIEEPLKLTSINPVVFTFIGFIAGCAAGGLFGVVYGIFLMLNEKW